jgi:hypothetical protein
MIIRLCDVAPNGSSKRISYGVLNLAMREGFDNPQDVVAGEAIPLCIKLDDTGYQIPAGHRLRLAVSSAYFPLLWPAKQETKLILDLDSACLRIPLHDRSETISRDLGQGYVCPINETKEIKPEKHSRIIQTNAANGRVTTLIDDDFGEFTFLAHNLTISQSCTEKHTILPHDPHSASSECRWHSRQSRPGWDIDVYTYLEVTCDGDYFYLDSGLEALENGVQIHHQQWQEKVPRGFA